MKFGSLFSGIGGFDLALERSGMECVWQCEIDLKATSVLKRHWPSVMRYSNVKTINKSNTEPVDLICGGFPCQDLSVAGKRKGLAGERSGLWFEFHRILSELKPQWVVIENVPGLLSSNRGSDFAVLLSGLADIGYLSAWRVLDAQFFGVAQRRRRVFIVGSLGDGRAAEVLFEREGVRWNPPPRRKEGEEVAGYTTKGFAEYGEGVGTLRSEGGDLSGGSETLLAYNIHQNDDKRKDRPNGGLYVDEAETGLTLQTGQGKSHTVVMAHGQANAEILEDQSPTLNVNHEQPIVLNDQGGSQMSISKDVTATIMANAHGHQPAVCWEMTHADEAYREAGDLAPNLQARMGTGGNNVPLVGVRRLTPTECERLQGFPDGWTDGQSDSARYKQLGNAVAVPVIEWIGKRIMEKTNEP